MFANVTIKTRTDNENLLTLAQLKKSVDGIYRIPNREKDIIARIIKTGDTLLYLSEDGEFNSLDDRSWKNEKFMLTEESMFITIS